jgi:hypothetical protein
VAAVALVSVQALVFVVFPVAAPAGFGRLFVLLVFVAVFAGHFFVGTRQVEVCGAVVKLGVFPRLCGVAVVAPRAQPPFVHIVFAVAAVAVLWRAAVFFARHMAAFARHVFVFAVQHVIRLPVVKGFGVELNDHGINPLVIGVAAAAALRLLPAVVTGFPVDVLSHVFVAFHTQAVLGLFVERYVAGAAVLLGFFVGLDHRAG